MEHTAVGTAFCEEVQAAIRQGAIVLAPRDRAARALRQALAASPEPPSQLPILLTLDAWMNQAWHRLQVAGLAARMLLSRSQEGVLWRQIVSADPEAAPSPSTDSLAELAASAWSTLCLHKGQTRLRSAAASRDTRAFARWAEAYTRLADQERYLTAAELPSALSLALQNAAGLAALSLPPHGLLLLDFDDLVPAYEDLFGVLSQAGVPVVRATTQTPGHPRLLHTALNERAELEAAARWARSQLERYPTHHIAIVVPGLAERRAEVDRVFSSLLAPELERFLPAAANDQAPSSQAGPFEFSLGSPLDQIPAVAIALNLLRLAQGPVSLRVVSDLLLSPSFGAHGASAEALAAAAFDAFELQQIPALRPDLTLTGLLRRMEASERKTALEPPRERLRGMSRIADAESTAVNSYAHWSDRFRLMLEASGWTDALVRTSFGFQLHRRTMSALDELTTLDFNGARPTAASALHALGRITRATIFAPESRDCPVQIMGPLELGGAPFDALWFLSAGNLTWPPRSGAEPLLPYALQRDLGCPGVDASRDAAAGRALTARIASSAAHVVFSFSMEIEAGHQRPSPALEGLALQPYETPPQPAAIPPLTLERVQDRSQLPPLAPPGPSRSPNHAPSHGGSEILALQAACGFRAFAEKRLFATAPAQRSAGLDARDRGSIVHDVMQHFWDRTASQQDLRALTEAARHQRLDEAIDHALTRAEALIRTPWDEAYLDIQRQRLRDLLQPWLTIELSRPPFTIRRNEIDQQNVQLGPLTLRLRVDRIDDTPLGPVLLDYKTGQADPADWRGERPEAPQLPLYAVIAQQPATPFAGVAFALLRAGDKRCLKGIAEDERVFGVKSAAFDAPSLPEQVEEWDRVLHLLADAFAAGDARVDPKQFPATCKYCPQRLLCRLDPAALGPQPDDDPAASTEGERG